MAIGKASLKRAADLTMKGDTVAETVKRGRTQPKKAEGKNTQSESVISKTLIKTSEKAESAIMPEVLSSGQTSRITCVLPTYLL